MKNEMKKKEQCKRKVKNLPNEERTPAKKEKKMTLPPQKNFPFTPLNMHNKRKKRSEPCEIQRLS